jgi:hypothetical protein
MYSHLIALSSTQDTLLKEPGGKTSEASQLVWDAVDGTIDNAFLQAPVLTYS